jgi:hypothetical protein
LKSAGQMLRRSIGFANRQSTINNQQSSIINQQSTISSDLEGGSHVSGMYG